MDLPSLKKKIAVILHNSEIRRALRASFRSPTGLLLLVCVVCCVVLKLMDIVDWSWIRVFYLLLSGFAGLLCGILIPWAQSRFSSFLTFCIVSMVNMVGFFLFHDTTHVPFANLIIFVSVMGFFAPTKWNIENNMKMPSGKALKYVPEELRTQELCLAAVEDEGNALRYVPEKLKTPELCLTAVQKDGWALEYVPEELKTPELCLTAVRRYGSALEYVPEKLRTPELCRIAVKNG